MKKRIFAAIFALIITLALTACGNKTDAPMAMPAMEAQSSEPEQNIDAARLEGTPPSESTAEPTQEINYALDTYTYTQTNDDGYVIEYTLNIGSWIRASDTEMLDSAWSAVGGTKETPTADAFIDYIGLEDFRNDRSVIAYGTLSLKNVTEGFDITAEYPLSTLISIKRPSSPLDETTSLGMWSVVMGFSDERKVQGRKSGEHNLSDAYTYANMTSNNWGSIPIAMATSNVFNPNNPDGNPLLGEIEFWFGTEQFCIKPIWNTPTEQTNQTVPDDSAISASQSSTSDFIGRWIGDGRSELEFMENNTVVWTHPSMTFETTYRIEGNQFFFKNESIFGFIEDNRLTLTDQNGLVSSDGTVVFQRA